MFGNRCVLQQKYVDCKIADVFLKKDTKQHTDGWDTSSKDWAHMVLHLTHAEGGFGVPFKCVTKDVAFYIVLLPVSWPGLVFSLRNVRSCGCLKMTFGTRPPHGHRPRLCFFETFTPSFLANTAAKRRSVHSLNHRLT
jgi:hypothetical protein